MRKKDRSRDALFRPKNCLLPRFQTFPSAKIAALEGRVRGLRGSCAQRLQRPSPYSMLVVSALLLTAVLVGANGGERPRCSAIFKGETESFPCSAALFSQSKFNVFGELEFSGDNLCSAQRTVCASSQAKRVVATRRGECTFAEKAANAHLAGFAALLIVNTNDALLSIGSSNASYRSPIPVLSVGSSFLSPLLPQHHDGHPERSPSAEDANGGKGRGEAPLEPLWSDGSAMYVSLSYGHQSSRSLSLAAWDWGEWVYRACILWSATIVFLPLLALPFAFRAAITKSPDSTPTLLSRAACLCSLVAVALLFLAVRLCTMRIVSEPIAARNDAGSLMGAYNHYESDEQIYEALVRSVLEDKTAYHLLSSPVLAKLQLPSENYGHSLFIHPPLFTYLSALIVAVFRVPLPLIPIVFQLLSLLCIAALSERVLRNTPWHGERFSLSVRAMVLFAVCPIAGFCSQKFWLDNLLLLTVLACLLLHLSLCRGGSHRRGLFFSGLCFGGVALNTKVTAWALLPCLLAECLWTRYDLLDGLVGCATFLAGAVLSHGPWLALYKHRTGRWLPSAWPSSDLALRFPFIAKVIGRPWHHYLTLVAKQHPLLIVGVGLAILIVLDYGLKAWRLRKLHRDSALAAFSLYPLAFLAALTLLGVLGAGYQARFLLPMLPGLCILAVIGIQILKCRLGEAVECWVMACMFPAIVHCLFYILSAPLQADVEVDLWDVLQTVLRTPLPETRLQAQVEVVALMRHYGLVRS